MKAYTNGEIVVYWEPDKCVHSANCVKGLPAVFNHKQRPWINMQGADSEEIMKAIDNCPSGALSYKRVDAGKDRGGFAARIKVMKGGPLLVEGECRLIGRGGEEVASCGPFALCRCGASRKKPFCDGSHSRVDFDDQG
ncbi:MAG: hypothetical protein GKC10_01795 [Methanosarcinales archaeon]|nr:hypothetical protein [Methanosarcinales archaeon]